MNEITLKKIWTEDGNFYEPNTMYEVYLTIKTDDYYIKKNFYVCNDLINELTEKLNKLINFQTNGFYFETSPVKKYRYKPKKKNYNEGFSFDFSVDNLGHISLIVELEIDNKKELGIRILMENLEYTEIERLLHGLEEMNNAHIDYVASTKCDVEKNAK